LTGGSNGDLSYGGIRGYNNSFLVDGGDNNNGFYGQAMGDTLAYQFSNESVQEFRVQSSGYGSESGRAGGAVVNVVTKSGTNTWHGSTFYYLRDSSLGGAAPPFVGVDPHNEQHQFGATVGGDPAQQDVPVCGFDQHIFNVRVVEFLNGSNDGRAAAGHLPEYFGLRSLQSGDWRFGVRSGHCAGCPPASEGGRPVLLRTRGGGGATFTEWRDETRALLGETGSVKLDRVLSAHSIFRCGEHGAVLRTNNVTFDSGVNYE